MRPLNLIPPEDRRGENAPLRAGIVSYAVIGVLAVALVAVVALVVTSNDINSKKSDIASLQARQAAAQAAAQSYAPYADFATLSTSRNQTVSDLARSRFDWERVLQELALVIPADVALQSLSASSVAGADDTGATSSSGPTIDISGCSEGGQEGTAALLAALRDIDGVTRVGMQTSSLNETSADGGAATADTGQACRGTGFSNFSITMTFDAVPAPASTGTAATPAAGTTTPTAPAAPATDTGASANDGGVAATQSEQAGSVDNANNQTERARNAVGSDAR